MKASCTPFSCLSFAEGESFFQYNFASDAALGSKVTLLMPFSATIHFLAGGHDAIHLCEAMEAI